MQRISNVGFVKTKLPSLTRKRVKRPQLQNRLLKLRTIHQREPSSAQLYRNARGVIDRGLQSTASHAPSLFVWLSARCGISMKEATFLATEQRIVIDGKPIQTAEDLSHQFEWGALAQQHIELVMDDGRRVPALHRARHRAYKLLHFASGMTMAAAEEDPRSFIHAAGLPPHTEPNLLYCPGFARGMRGLTLATNDCTALPRLWNNHELGISGRFEVEFRAGVPDELLKQLARLAENYVTVRYAPSPDLGLSPHVVVRRITKHLGAAKSGGGSSGPSRSGARTIENVAVLDVRAPLLPHKLYRTMLPHAQQVTVTELGPFKLPSELKPRAARSLSPQELQTLFLFERKLKTNRLVRSLREVMQATAEDDETNDGAEEVEEDEEREGGPQVWESG